MYSKKTGVLAALLLALCGSARAADDFPTRPIRILVPFAPGGVVDVTARLLGQKMTERLGWNIVVDNRPGGNGFIAVNAAAKAEPDGYTLLMAHTGEFAVNPAVFANRIPYELERDFAPITMISDTPMLVIANSQAPFNNFKEMVAAAKAKPDTITFSSPGTGSVNHLAGEWLGVAAGVKLRHIPYKGGAPAAAAAASGEVATSVVAVPAAIAHLKSGKVKVIGLTTAKRTPYEKSWATAREAGIPDIDSSNWVGLFAPKGVPPATLEKIYTEVKRTLDDPAVRQRFAEVGAETGGMPPAEFTARIKRDEERYRQVVKAANVKPE